MEKEKEIPDTKVYRMVVTFLGLAILLVVIGIVVITVMGKSMDANLVTIFTAIASGAIGALAGLLAPSPTGNG